MSTSHSVEVVGIPMGELEQHLAAALPLDLADPALELVRLDRRSGGNSRITYLATVRGTDGLAELVVQRSRTGPVSEAERGAMKAARDAGVPAPEIVAGGTDSAVGEDILVTRALPGIAAPQKLASDPELSSARHELPGTLGRAVGLLHASSLDGRRRAVGSLGQLAARYATTGYHRPAVALALRMLRLRAVPQRQACLVHGDLRIGNLLVDHTGLVAIVDWEVAHLGHPGEDLGWLLNPVWRLDGCGPLDQPDQIEELLAAYSSVTGWRPSPTELVWWQLWGACLWVVACLELTDRSRRALVPDAEQLAAGLQVPVAERTVLDLLEAMSGG